jgi:hypothetical protein
MKQKIIKGEFISKIEETIALPSNLMNIYSTSIAQLKIQETSQLETDPNVIHPCVKVHIVDLLTGTYLQKQGMS